jgi:hypothetical protein
MRRGGITVLALVLLAGVFRPGAGAPSTASPNATRSARATSSSQDRTKTTLTAGAPPNPVSSKTYEADLKGLIQSFFGKAEKGCPDSETDKVLAEHWNVPCGERAKVLPVIATLPDPLHTQLGLLFDRGIDSIQHAAQESGYNFDFALMPWDRREHLEPDDFRLRKAEKYDTEQREGYPGLMSFHASGESDRLKASPYLFVFIVGETPTGGINKDQFSRALNIVEAIQKKTENSTDAGPNSLRILGPTFSGSLYSLSHAIQQSGIHTAEKNQIPIFSGSVTGVDSIDNFNTAMRKSANLVAFQVTDKDQLEKFCEFLTTQSFPRSRIVVLSEDETTYGSQSSKCSSENVKRVEGIRFPRQIAQFRAAYQKEVANAPQTEGAREAPRTTLPQDLQTTGSEDDTVAPYAQVPSALSQESTMMGIVSLLQQKRPDFIIIMATDPLDQVFLVQYLRRAYPEARLVVSSPDLLLARTNDVSIRGILGIGNYTLVPALGEGPDKSGDTSNDSHIFADIFDAGTFRAMYALLSSGDPQSMSKDSKGRDGQSPPLRLTILGRGGYWRVLNLTDASSTASPPAIGKPGTWKFAYGFCVVLALVHVWFSLFGSVIAESEAAKQFANISSWQRTALILVGGLVLVAALFSILIAAYPGTDLKTFVWKNKWTWLPLPCLFAFSTLDVWRRVRMRWVAASMILVEIVICFIMFKILASHDFDYGHQSAWSLRILDFGSGVSPILPLLLLLAASYWWVWYCLKGLTLLDDHCARLPADETAVDSNTGLPLNLSRPSERDADTVRAVARPLSLPMVVLKPLAILLVLSLLLYKVSTLWPLVHSIEGVWYDKFYSGLLIVMVIVFLGSLWRLLQTWVRCRAILRSLETMGVRHAFSRLEGFPWKPLWSPAGSPFRESSKVLFRAIENLKRLLHIIDTEEPPRIPPGLKDCREQIENTVNSMGKVAEKFEEIKLNRNRSQENDLVNKFGELQIELPKVADKLLQRALFEHWREEMLPVSSNASNLLPPLRPPRWKLIAEEYVALVYVNFITSIILRMRTQVMAAIGMYVLIVASTIVYPFEPGSVLRALGLGLFAVGGFVIVCVYAQMHRNSILSRLTTSKEEGELGFDFWLKIGAAGALPILSLLASQFPSIGNLLFSWLEPALQAIK